jgi:hypothetical protein
MRICSRLGALAAAAALLGGAAPGAVAKADVPAYGTITIADAGLGPRATWTYDGVLDCRFTTAGPAGVVSRATVTCWTTELTPSLNCSLMVLQRSGIGVAGGRATCDTTIDTGVTTNNVVTTGDLGHVYVAIICVAYVNNGVLVPPYSVSCTEPGLPAAPTGFTLDAVEAG